MKYDYECPICKSNQILKKKNYVFNIPERLVNSIETIKNKKITFSVNYCIKCGNLFLFPRFTEKEYSIKFSDKSKPYFPLTLPKPLLLRSYANYLFLKQFFNYNSSFIPKILDYGGSAGYMLIPFLKKFDCYLIDYFKYDLPKGIKYLGRNLNEADCKIKFDVIMALRVLEHVNNPLDLIKEFMQVIDEKGIIYIQVPLGCLWEWKSLDTPFRHINYFSEQSLFNLFRIAGLDIIYLKTQYYQYGGNPGWKIDIIGKRSRSKYKHKNVKYFTTEQQQTLKYVYFIPYFIKNKKFKFKDIKKILNVLVQHFRRFLAKII